MKKFVFVILAWCFFAGNSGAFTFNEWKHEFVGDVKKIWYSGNYDAYVPFYAWHNRLTYDDKHIAKYNEKAFGFGLGKSIYDENGNWYGLYAFAFRDSNSKLETVAGFAYQKNWTIDNNDNWKVGVGYTLGVTQREEYAYIPIPMPLPIVGVEYKNMALQAAYVPGLKNFGNVALFWLRVRLY